LLALAALLLVADHTELPEVWMQQSTLSLRILDRDGRFLFEEPAANGRFGAWLPGGRIPKNVRIATLAAEDHRLFQHPGVDPVAVLRALRSNLLKGRRVSGASTLAMQVIRQWAPAKRTYRNKIREMFWALVLQSKLGPEGVLREYVNRAPYGNRVQGVQRAALLYFDKPAADLSLAEAAFLAALPWGPGVLNPFRTQGRKRAWRRARHILKRARQLGMINRETWREALRDPIRVQKKPKRELAAVHWTEMLSRVWRRSKSGSLRQVTTVRTSLDLPLQRIASKALRGTLNALSKRNAGTGAVIVMDHRSGEILAYVGSHSYFDKPARGAIDYLRTPRPPGSTLKPFVYGMAMEKTKMTGATLLSDLAVSYFWKRGHYRPRNYDYRYLGPIRLRPALGNSRNIPVIKALVKVGVPPMLKRLRQLGMKLPGKSERYGLGLALGNGGVRLLRLARSYGILARRGRGLPLTWAVQARASLGQLVPASRLPTTFLAPKMTDKALMSAPVAAVLSDILSDPMARLPAFPNFSQYHFPFKVAVKTGTSQGFRDAWMVGYSDRVVVGCWIGNHDRRRMKKVSGAKGCSQLFATVMRAAMKRTQRTFPRTFARPVGWKKQTICALSGHKATPHCHETVEEWLPHSHKHTLCPFHKALKVDKRNGLLATPRCPVDKVEKRVFVSMPSSFAGWVKMMGLLRPPRRLSPLCPGSRPLVAKAPSLKIMHPPHKARYLLDPSIPAESSTLGLKARVNQPLKKVLWFANGRLIGSSSWPYKLRWPMKQGTWELIATSPDRLHRSRPVTVTVR
jgi:penicillin-binding protein 1C